MNVIEIDAASNNGVDNIREIREEVAYSPTEGKYKVYIIDEVHMLSIGAFNALLKTLEEPPSYVIFILATTEAHKIPVTILSRCQRYDFRRITADTILARLQELMEAEHVTAEEKALRYIAKAADGSMRDALSLLDQCIAFYLNQDLTYEHVLDVLGAVDTAVYSALLRSTLAQDLPAVMGQIEELVLQGRELGQFVTDFTWYLRNLLLLKSSDEMEEVLDVSAENLQQLKEEARYMEMDTLMRYIRIFSELGGQTATRPRSGCWWRWHLSSCAGRPWRSGRTPSLTGSGLWSGRWRRGSPCRPYLRLLIPRAFLRIRRRRRRHPKHFPRMCRLW